MKKAIILMFLLFSPIVYANDKFLVEHDVIYEVDIDKNTNVTQNIAITSRENDVIATNYSLIVNQTNITEEQGIEDEKDMAVKKETNEESTKLTAFFNEVAVGEGSVKDFTINYKTTDIVYKNGDIWYINIPKSQITEATTLYNVRLIIPKSFGEKIFVSPIPSIEKEEREGYITYYFTKEDLRNTGITAAFGTHQVLNFKLKYQIHNDTLLSSIYEVALPSDIKDYQQISFTNIDPTPKKIYVDEDGNFIAQYKVSSKEKLEIEVLGSVKLLTKQINPKEGGNIKDIPADKKKYLKSDTYWEVDNTIIQNLADKLYFSDMTTSQNAQNIYSFIVDNLVYDTNAINKPYIQRQGGLNALNIDSPVACMEFTDLFITLSRAMGIPAREVNGYALTNNNLNLPSSINLKSGDLLHSWAEYYDPDFGWVQIDPTWGNTSGIDYFTKLDTNHFSFVIRGINSVYPLSAGMYRYEDIKRLIEVDFAETDSAQQFEPRLNVEKTINFSPIHILLGYKRYKVTNIGNVFVYDLNNKELAPGDTTKLFIHRKTKEIKYMDFNSNEKVLNII